MAAFGGVSFLDACRIPYELSSLGITAVQPVTAGTGFQGIVFQMDIKRVIAVSTKAHWLAYGLEFVLDGSYLLLLSHKLLSTL